ncbi:ser/thr protein phosphatase [Novymonas esmeraldas]|uniref:Ser/thr protein phosphatase n=1 Tax=Novymonas esmeraldas TaxID=1808958 RepID=A0AAW0EL00_9TRYP
MEDKSRQLLSQLSGLRLSDGSVVGSRLGTGHTPPTLTSASPDTSPATATPSTFPVASLAGEVHGAAHEQQRRGVRAAPADVKKHAESPTPSTSVTDKINRLLAQNKGSLANMNAAAESSATAGILSSLAAQVGQSSSPSSSNGAAASTPTATPTTAAATPVPAAQRGATVPVPRPRSVEAGAAAAAKTPVPAPAAAVAAESLNPTVMEFFHKAAGTSRSPPPTMAAPTAALKTAVVLEDVRADRATSVPGGGGGGGNGRREKPAASPSVTSAPPPPPPPPAAAPPVSSSNARSTNPPPPPSSSAAKAPSKEAIDPANRFLADAFGAVDNLDAVKPIIRVAPEIGSEGRYIIIGDVHGCVEQLEQLVEKVKYVKGTDCLLIIGDYVNKGPDSIGAVRACQRLGAYGVLGNHDYTLLRCCARMRRRPFTPDDLRDPVKRLAQKFPKDCEHYLRGLPHMVRIPRHNVLLVHAGLNLQHSLENQNVEEVMHLRRLEPVANKPGSFKAIAKGMDGEPWASLWEGPEMVIFGHDAYSGFQAHTHACGIDTGCVYGDPLTCVVYGRDSPTGDFFSVPGLPKLQNEMKGLPPPTSDIYEQEEVDLAKLIIRPTTRATPAILNGSVNGRPVFLAAPLGYAEAEEHAASPSTKVSNMTATVTSTNTRMTPNSMSPSRLATPTCAANVRLMETTTVNTREVQRATLLALSATRELSAIAVLLAMPLYAQEVDAMLSAEATDTVSQEAFWIPFARLILVAAAAMPRGDTAALAAVVPALQLALDVCEEMEEVAATLQAELTAFTEAERASPAWPKRVVKCAETLVTA